MGVGFGISSTREGCVVIGRLSVGAKPPTATNDHPEGVKKK